MINFCFFCKTYDKDFKYFKNLYESFKKHNLDNIPLYVSVPTKDSLDFLNQFPDLQNTLLLDEDISDCLTLEPYKNFTAGYINQQIIKLSFATLNLANYYFLVDSETIFIRDFNLDDFIINGKFISVLHLDKDLYADKKYFNLYGINRSRSIFKIAKKLDFNSDQILTCHGHTIMNTEVVDDFLTNYLNPRCLTFYDIIKEEPFEFTWYNIWLQKYFSNTYITTDPIIKTFHLEKDYLSAIIANQSIQDLSISYIGYCMNSNWSTHNKFNPPTVFTRILAFIKLLIIHR
jgi:hypothetical protein